MYIDIQKVILVAETSFTSLFQQATAERTMSYLSFMLPLWVPGMKTSWTVVLLRSKICWMLFLLINLLVVYGL